MDPIFVSSEEIPTVLLENGRYFKIPKPAETTFVHELLKIALDLQADAILPLSILEIQRMSLETKLFEEYGINIHLPAAAGNGESEEVEVMVNPPRAFELTWSYTGFLTYNDDSQAFVCLAE